MKESEFSNCFIIFVKYDKNKSAYTVNTRSTRSTVSTALLASSIILSIPSCSTVPSGPCDIYESHGTPCVAAHSTTRVLKASYKGPLYQIRRESDGKTLDIMPNCHGIADAASQDRFSEGTLSYITIIYDQSGHGNHLYQAAPGTFKGPARGQFNTLPIADMAPVTISGHKAYGAYLMPGMGYRNNNASDLAINDEAEGIYYVIDGTHFDSGCCFDYGNSSTNGDAVGTGTMETVYFGTSTAWGSGNGEGPWIMADMEAGLFSGYNHKKNDVPSITDWRFVSVFVNGGDGNRWDLNGGDATKEELTTFYSGARPHTPESSAYYPMSKKGAILLGNGGDNGNGSAGTFYEGVMTVGYPSQECIREVQANIAAARYDVQPMTLSRLTSFVGAETTQPLTFSFTNTTGKTLEGLSFDVSLPEGWSADIESIRKDSFEPGRSLEAEFNVTAPGCISGGYLTLTARWKGGSESISTRIRRTTPVKINEVGLLDGGFIELYNPSDKPVDLSGYEIQVTRSGWAPAIAARFPDDAVLSAGEYRLLELSDEARAMSEEALTTIFIPVSTGPWLRFDKGCTTLPATSTDGFAAGQILGIGDNATYEEVEITSIGTAATQTRLSKEAKAGDTVIEIGYTERLHKGSVITISTGQRTEKAVVEEVIDTVAAPPYWEFGMPRRKPQDPGRIRLAEPLKGNHMLGVDVSCEGTGISFKPGLKYAHESGEALQANPARTLCTDGNHFGYALSPKAGTVAVYKDGVLIDGVTYGSKQSNSSGNGTICRPDIATLEGDQAQGGCLAEVPNSWNYNTPAIGRYPDGVDRDKLCADFNPTDTPTPGQPNVF